MHAHRCRWTSLHAALAAFAEYPGSTQTLRHILPLHWYIACRLVVEGGFNPDDIVPRPPFRVERRRRRPPLLHFDPALGGGGEGIVIGGIKAKHIDVLVTLEQIGPVMSVSCKGVTGAFRNLGNRLEEMVGESTNLHMTHPALVMGHIVILRANQQERPDDTPREGPQDTVRQRGGGDVAILADGAIARPLRRFHDALRDLGLRQSLLDHPGRCEGLGLALVGMAGNARGQLDRHFPEASSGLGIGDLFDALYTRYDERFARHSLGLKRVTARHCWDPLSPGLRLFGLDYQPRTFS
ncbi:hypothetical protein [Novosphingobium cyanobacteriorum]|uniref:Uncharacterized protein n=1 Tax=Novosphingobium cyanobacteriorum TaxID=3024215 RepID=A0ABT6CIS2_9SPHN|nr:hypothetical protein [Novosphingobium cyanobacteriorum]MDF8333691.1 hypothetical protein [Novosphingobium cyanobacteriorum]